MSDEGLRAELEKLCRDWAAEGHDGADQLSQILTAHPAESVPVADRERVAEVLDRVGVSEAASCSCPPAQIWGSGGDLIDQDSDPNCPEHGEPSFRSEAVALDREVVLNAMIVAIYETDGQPIGLVRQQLPQHEWQLLSIAADAVMKLARPEAVALDREAVRVAVRQVVMFGVDTAKGLDAADAITDAVMKLARPEAVVKAEAVREAADAYAPGSHDWHKFRQWLRERADEMEEK